ncbi:hypothetical protein UT300016_11750 [Clostridium senegalense]
MLSLNKFLAGINDATIHIIIVDTRTIRILIKGKLQYIWYPIFDFVNKYIKKLIIVPKAHPNPPEKIP